MPVAEAARREDQALTGPTDTPATSGGFVADSSESLPGPPDLGASERVILARHRLAGGFYERPEILERIAEAIWRALAGRA